MASGRSTYLTVILFSYFLSEISGPFVFSGPNYLLSLSFLLFPLLGFIRPFLLGPNDP